MPLYHFIHLFIHSQRLFGIGLNTLLLLLLYIFGCLIRLFMVFPIANIQELDQKKKVEETKTINVSCSISY